MDNNEIMSLKENVSYWETEFYNMRNDRDYYLKLFQKAYREIPHSCDNCDKELCEINSQDSGGCTWRWIGFKKENK